MPSTNIRMLQTVANGLGELKAEMVFVGGAVAELYADNPAASEIRPTIDVDCVLRLVQDFNLHEWKKILEPEDLQTIYQKVRLFADGFTKTLKLMLCQLIQVSLDLVTVGTRKV